MKGTDKMVAGRVRMLFSNIFFGTLATGLALIKSNAVPTAGTDGTFIIFNPEFTDKLSKEEIIFLLAHEVMHIVLMTHLRRGNRDMKVWNMATDYAINLILKAENFRVIEGSLLDTKYTDWSAEKIYQHLIDNPEEQPGEGAGESGWNIGEVMDAGSIQEDGDVQPGQALTSDQLKAAEGKMKSKIQAAAISAKKAGSLPGSIARIIDDICAPKADWREVLSRFVSEKAFNDWEHGTCHVRMLQQYGVISPRIGGEALGKLAIIVDTSGSVDEKQLAQFAGEISDILDNYECEICVVYCDTSVNRTDIFTQDDLPLRLQAVGGGGTLGRPAYDWVDDNLKEAAAIIHYTDSYLFDWDKIPQPPVPVLMACTSERPDRDTPDWIERIDIS